MAVINNILFDLDGTLADTAPDLASSLNQLLGENHRQALPFTAIRPMVSHGGIYMICRAFAISESDPDFTRLRERFLAIYATRLADETRLFPGMAEVLAHIESEGFSWGIVTNKSERLTLPLVAALGLADRAACIVGGDTLAQSKPHPAPILHACQLLHCSPSQSLYIGDAEKDVIAGRQAAMHTLVARYGYLGSADEPETWGADGLIDSPGEILDWLSKRRDV